MKILIIDDETNKLGDLLKIIKAIPGLNQSEITYVLDLYKGKQALSTCYFDLLILDLNIPENIEQEPNHTAGADFLFEIMHTDVINKPNDIIILTAYDESLDKIHKNKELYGFIVLKYSRSSTEWADVIKAKILYDLSKEAQIREKYPELEYDVGIITSVPVETNAVYGIADVWKEFHYPDDPTMYRISELKGTTKTIKVIQAQQNEMGMSCASTLTTKIILHFHPKYLIIVGIAAGIGKSCRLGDIIIPSEIWNYSSGKYMINENKDSLFAPDPKYLQLNPRIKETIIKADYVPILGDIKKRFPGIKPQHEISIINDPMACGTAVIASPEITKEMILKHSRKTCGLDMESYGVFYAANNVLNDSTIAICIKSVCDFADEDKNDQYQNYAAYTSAQFMKYYIQSVLFP